MSEIATYGWGEWQMDFMADEGDYVRVEDYRKLEQRLAEAVEAAYFEGWRDGYHASEHCLAESDWLDSDACLSLKQPSEVKTDGS